MKTNKMYYLRTSLGYIAEYWQEQDDTITTTDCIADAIKFDTINDVYLFINANYNVLSTDIVFGMFIEEYEQVNEYKWICVRKIPV